ncbi:MAG: ATP-binding protein [Chloroflexi bacterium]|nr:ATP-binding protein [Chloroflexota bacterium]
MEYREFLEVRRELIAQVIADGYKTLSDSPADLIAEEKEMDIEKLLLDGESEALEFKSTLRINLHTGKPDIKMELAVLKTLAGFLNTSSGTLIIGVSDDGSSIGLEIEGFENEDKMALHLVNIIKSRMGMQAMANIHLHFEDYQDGRVLVVETDRISTPVFVLGEDKKERFYIRTGPSTSELTPSQTQEYIKQRFK